MGWGVYRRVAVIFWLFVYFFKQKTAYEMRISDWSADVCSSDLALSGGDSLSVKIDDAQGGNYEKLDIDATPADTTVTDVQDTTGLTLSASDTVAEGGSIVYTATLTNAAGTDRKSTRLNSSH